MTRQKALEVSRALESIDMFECLADSLIQVLVDEGADVPDILIVEKDIRAVLDKELERRKAVLEAL